MHGGMIHRQGLLFRSRIRLFRTEIITDIANTSQKIVENTEFIHSFVYFFKQVTHAAYGVWLKHTAQQGKVLIVARD